MNPKKTIVALFNVTKTKLQLLIGFTDGVIRVYSVANGSAPGSSLMKFIKSLTVKMKLLQVRSVKGSQN